MVTLPVAVLQVPPGTVSVAVPEEYWQMDSGAVMVPTAGVVVTVTVKNDDALPQLLLMVYIIVSTPRVAPVTTPPETVVLVFVAPHVPPVILGVNVTVDDGQTTESPLMVAADGKGLIVNNTPTILLHPNVLVTVYLIESVPTDMPVASPAVPTEALPSNTLHVPPVVASASKTESPRQTEAVPVIAATTGKALIVTGRVTLVVVPHPLVTE